MSGPASLRRLTSNPFPVALPSAQWKISLIIQAERLPYPVHNTPPRKTWKNVGELRVRLLHCCRFACVINQASVDAGYQGSAVRRIIAEFLQIPSMVAPRPRSKIGNGEQKECKAARRPGRDRPPKPFEDFPEVVGARDEPEPAAMRYRISSLARPAQAHEGVVGVEIEREPGQENSDPDQESGVGQPIIGVLAEFRDEAGVMYALIELKKKPDATSSRGIFRPRARTRNGWTNVRFR